MIGLLLSVGVLSGTPPIFGGSFQHASLRRCSHCINQRMLQGSLRGVKLCCMTQDFVKTEHILAPTILAPDRCMQFINQNVLQASVKVPSFVCMAQDIVEAERILTPAILAPDRCMYFINQNVVSRWQALCTWRRILWRPSGS